MGSAGMKYGPVHNELNGSDTHGSLATSGQSFGMSSERETAVVIRQGVYMVFPQLTSTVKIPISLGTLARDMSNHRPSSSWEQETTVRSDVSDKHFVTSRPEAHAPSQPIAGTKRI